jgi:hypothetical protein
MTRLAPLITLVFVAPLDLTIPVGVEAAYVVVTSSAEAVTKKCCGLCHGGKVIHGDGHVTDCACPATCACKKNPAVVHPPSVLRCKDGTCTPKK